eukprot:362306-Chlamydomonas_euryale.AAC.1
MWTEGFVGFGGKRHGAWAFVCVCGITTEGSLRNCHSELHSWAVRPKTCDPTSARTTVQRGGATRRPVSEGGGGRGGWRPPELRRVTSGGQRIFPMKKVR